MSKNIFIINIIIIIIMKAKSVSQIMVGVLPKHQLFASVNPPKKATITKTRSVYFVMLLGG